MGLIAMAVPTLSDLNYTPDYDQSSKMKQFEAMVTLGSPMRLAAMDLHGILCLNILTHRNDGQWS